MSSGRLLVVILGILLLWGILTGVTACRELVQGFLAENVRLTHEYHTIRAMPPPAAVAIPEYHTAMNDSVEQSRWGMLGYLVIGVFLALGYMFSAMTGHKGINGLIDAARKYRGQRAAPAARPPSLGQGLTALPPDHPDAWAYNPNQLQPPAARPPSPDPAAGSWLVPRSGGQGGN